MVQERQLPADFGARMTLARKRIGASRKTLSRLMNADGASESTIKKYEMTKPPGSLIAIPFVARLSAVTGVSEDYFWGDDAAWPGLQSRGPRPVDPIEERLAQIETTQQAILRRLDELAEQQGMLTDLERERLSEVAAVLDRLGRDVGRGQPRQRSGRSSPPEASAAARGSS